MDYPKIIQTHLFQTINQLFNIEGQFHIIAGPCSVESMEQMEQAAQFMVDNGIRFIRGGAYKPRTSPYNFRGLGLSGLKILNKIREKYGLLVVTEIMDTRDVAYGVEFADIIQIGSRNMTNFSLLEEVGKTNHPVLLKRGLMSTYEEFLYAAEYIALNGNTKIIMCERGIRTFETITRNTLDITCMAMLKHQTSLPIIADLSHSLGRKDIILPITKCLKTLGADGVMLEVHPLPLQAKSDNEQQLDLNEFKECLTLLQEF